MPIPFGILAMAAAVTDLLILAGGVMASMTDELPESSCSMSETPSKVILSTQAEHPGDAGLGQDLNETQASSVVVTNVGSVLSSDVICPMTTHAIPDEQPTIPHVPLDNEPVVPTDQSTYTPLLDEQTSTAGVPEFTRLGLDPLAEEQRQGPSTVFPRKRRASSIASSLESMISHESFNPSEFHGTDMNTSASTLVADGSQSLSHSVAKPSGPSHDYPEEPANKRRREAVGRELRKVYHSTCHKLSDLRPRNYRYKFRKEIRPTLSRKDSTSTLDS